VEAATAGIWNIKMLFQSAQSPDTNIIDLAFFQALQSTQFDLGFATNTNGLIDQVLEAFRNYNPIALNNTFLHYNYTQCRSFCNALGAITASLMLESER
jgi:hypothetical protein